jgi:hypothetical protein
MARFTLSRITEAAGAGRWRCAATTLRIPAKNDGEG